MASTAANLLMFGVGVALLVVVFVKYKNREPNVLIEPEFPLMFKGSVINEVERTGTEAHVVQQRRQKAVDTVGRMVLEISALPVDSFTVRGDLDRLSRQKLHRSCAEDYIYDMMQTLVFDTQFGDPLKGGLSERQYDGIAFAAAKAYLKHEGLGARSYVSLADIC